MIEITRHEKDGVLQGFSFWAYPDPVVILVHEQGLWHSKTDYYGWGSFGAINPNVEVTGFETMQEADDYITANGLTYSGTHTFQTLEGITIFKNNPNAETEQIAMVGNNLVQHTEQLQTLSGDVNKIIDYIFAESFDISGIVTFTELLDGQTTGPFVKKGKLIVHNEILYIVNQPHEIQADWTPNISHALFSTHWPDGVIGDWRQPLGAHDTYKIGMMVRHNGWVWRCDEGDAEGFNSWEPGVFGWTQVYEIEPDDEEETPPEWSSFASHEFQNMDIGTPVMDEGTVYYLINPSQGHWKPSSNEGYLGWSTTQP